MSENERGSSRWLVIGISVIVAVGIFMVTQMTEKPVTQTEPESVTQPDGGTAGKGP